MKFNTSRKGSYVQGRNYQFLRRFHAVLISFFKENKKQEQPKMHLGTGSWFLRRLRSDALYLKNELRAT